MVRTPIETKRILIPAALLLCLLPACSPIGSLGGSSAALGKTQTALVQAETNVAATQDTWAQAQTAVAQADAGQTQTALAQAETEEAATQDAWAQNQTAVVQAELDYSQVETAIAESVASFPTDQFNETVYEAPTPPIFAYSTPVAFAGEGPVQIPAQDDILLALKPGNQDIHVKFVKSLVLYTQVTDPHARGPMVLGFSLWAPADGGWGMNQGKDTIPWGTQTVGIKYPDSYVSRSGTVMLDIQNSSQNAVSIDKLSLTMDYVDTKGSESVINPLP